MSVTLATVNTNPLVMTTGQKVLHERESSVLKGPRCEWDFLGKIRPIPIADIDLAIFRFLIIPRNKRNRMEGKITLI